MGYEYYCTSCAKKLSNEIVLFDLQSLLSASKEKKFSILNYRLTEREVIELIGAGEGVGSNRWRCRLSFAEIMAKIGNPYNLNDPVIAGLTLQDISDYLEADLFSQNQIVAAAENDTISFDDDDFDEAAETKAPEEELKAPPREEKPVPAAITALLAKHTSVESAVFTEEILKEDLRMLRQNFALSDSFVFELTLKYETDDRGSQVLVGMIAFLNSASVDMSNCRVCPYCGDGIFDLAGTAEHRSVVFIGYKESGKTSAILSLTHYAINHMKNDMGEPIWESADTVAGLDTVQQLSPSQRLITELELYTQGIAPNRTLLQAGLTNAYSSTFLIKSRGTGGKTVSRILTLTDLPGELLCAYGKLRVTDIYNNFAVATACDTFVVCLDTSTVEKAADGTLSTAIIQDSSGNAVKRTPSEVVSDTCIWADEFQKMLIQTGNKTKYVPMILLFTKCHQMENDIAAEDSRTPKTFDPLKKAYLLRSEQLRIEQNRFYDIACREFNSTGGLSNAYHAMLRCSPYGYKAPDPDEVLKGAEPHPPKPKHIDKLMQWILTVAGCVPMTAAYSADVNDVSRLERLVYVERPQHRQENPMKGSEVEEALLRCSLFVNPGKYDREFLKFANQKSVLFAKKLLAKADSNAE